MWWRRKPEENVVEEETGEECDGGRGSKMTMWGWIK